MALEKEIKLKSGVIVSYWKIGQTITINYQHGMILINLEGYLTKENRDQGMDPVANETIQFKIAFLDSQQDLKKLFYNSLKKLDYFINSEDV